jgi:hypothetical protein
MTGMTELDLSTMLAQVRDRAFWQALVPGLTVSDDIPFDGLAPWALPFNDEAAFRAQLDREGYVHLPQLMEPALVRRLAGAVDAVARHGLPPLFCLVYDEFWIPAFRLSAVMRAAFGAEASILPATWIWHIDPARSESGWQPHRDGGPATLLPDGRPKRLTTWLALTEATPLNGCMYVVPADRDPSYGRTEQKGWSFALPDVRALPAQAGDVFLWTQQLLHWGSHAAPRGQAPRMSLSIEFAHGSADGTPNIVEPEMLRRFEHRLRFVAQMMVHFNHLSGLPPDFAVLAWSL